MGDEDDDPVTAAPPDARLDTHARVRRPVPRGLDRDGDALIPVDATVLAVEKADSLIAADAQLTGASTALPSLVDEKERRVTDASDPTVSAASA